MSHKTYIRPEQWREKISRALKKYWDTHPKRKEEVAKLMTGRKLSIETRKKISKNHIGVKGADNPRWKGGDTKYHWSIAHRIWKEYWHEKIPNGYILHHLDGNPKNNNIWNLAMVTRSFHKKMEYAHYHQWKQQFIGG